MGNSTAVEAAFGVDPRALNALTHGLTSKHVLKAEIAAFDIALESLRKQHEPVGVCEEALMRRIARLVVRLERAAQIDALCFAQCFDDRGDHESEPMSTGHFNHVKFQQFVETISRYELSIGRALAKCLHEFERLSMSRKGQEPSKVIHLDLNW